MSNVKEKTKGKVQSRITYPVVDPASLAVLFRERDEYNNTFVFSMTKPCHDASVYEYNGTGRIFSVLKMSRFMGP